MKNEWGVTLYTKKINCFAKIDVTNRYYFKRICIKKKDM